MAHSSNLISEAWSFRAHGFSAEEISKELNVPLGTIRLWFEFKSRVIENYVIAKKYFDEGALKKPRHSKNSYSWRLYEGDPPFKHICVMLRDGSVIIAEAPGNGSLWAPVLKIEIPKSEVVLWRRRDIDREWRVE